MKLTTSLETARNLAEAKKQLGVDDVGLNDESSLYALIGGDHVFLGLAHKPKNSNKPEDRRIVISELSCPSQVDNVKVLLDIYELLAQKGLELATFSVAGFTAEADPEITKRAVPLQENEIQPGDTVMANEYVNPENGSPAFHKKSKRMINFIDELAKRSPGRELHYSDNKHKETNKIKIGNGRALSVYIGNDLTRGAIGALTDFENPIIKKMLKEENINRVGSLMNSTGYNFGVGYNYSKDRYNFNDFINKEVGADSVPQELMGPLDQEFTGSKEEFTIGHLFSGGKSGVQALTELRGIRREIAVLYETLDQYSTQNQDPDGFLSLVANYYNQAASKHKLGYSLSLADIKNSPIMKRYQSSKGTGNHLIPNNSEITSFAEESLGKSNYDKFAHAMLVSLYSRLAKYSISQYQEDINKMKLLVINGRTVLDVLAKVPAAKDALIKPFKEINPDLRLYVHQLGTAGGIKSILENSLNYLWKIREGDFGVSEKTSAPSKDGDSQVKKPGLIKRFFNWLGSFL